MATKGKEDVEEIALDIKDARVTTFGNVNYYQWDSSISHGGKTWTMGPLAGLAVNGGIHVKGWYQVFMTDSYPTDNVHWKVGSYNSGLGTVDVTVYALSLT